MTLCNIYGLDIKTCYERKDSNTENDNTIILWEFMIRCDNELQYRKPNTASLEKEINQAWVIDIACVADNKIWTKEEKETEKYGNLRSGPWENFINTNNC